MIVIEDAGDLRSALHGYWFDGEDGGFFSPLHHASKLKIRDNSHAMRDLVAYVEGAYPLGEHWEWHELSRDMKVEITWTYAEPQLV